MSARSFGFSRRDSMRLLGLGAFAAMFGTPGSTARADDAPPATDNLQGAGFYRFLQGGGEVILVSDGGFYLDIDHLLASNAGPDALQKAYDEANITAKDTMGHINTLFINDGAKKILVDTGCGSGFGPGCGHFLKNLERAGVKGTDITDVIITHLHPDHVGLLIDDGGAAKLPNATFHLHKDEQSFWSGANPDLSKSGLTDDMKPQMVAGAQKALAAIKDRMKLVDDGATVGSVQIVHLPGHTPGHCGVRYENGGTLMHFTDAVHFPLFQFGHPDWYMAYDTDQKQGVETRKKILDMVVKERMVVTGAHLNFPAVGRVRSMGDAFAWQPTIWQW